MKSSIKRCLALVMALVLALPNLAFAQAMPTPPEPVVSEDVEAAAVELSELELDGDAPGNSSTGTEAEMASGPAFRLNADLETDLLIDAGQEGIEAPREELSELELGGEVLGNSLSETLPETTSAPAFEQTVVLEEACFTAAAAPGVYPEGAALWVERVRNADAEAASEAALDAAGTYNHRTYHAQVLDAAGDPCLPNLEAGLPVMRVEGLPADARVTFYDETERGACEIETMPDADAVSFALLNGGIYDFVTVEAPAPEAVQVIFECEPSDAAVTVYPLPTEENPEPEAIPAGEDGVYTLPCGEYVYDAAAGDCMPVEGATLSVTGEESPLRVFVRLVTEEESLFPLSVPTKAQEPEGDSGEFISVTFERDPADAVVTVYPASDSTSIAAESDGSYLLYPGSYTYSVEAEGCAPVTRVPFTASLTEGGQTIAVTLERLTYSIAVKAPVDGAVTVMVNGAETAEAKRDDAITLTVVKPDCLLSTVTGPKGKIRPKASGDENGVYTFTMPAGNVTVLATALDEGQVPIHVTHVLKDDSVFRDGEEWEYLFDNNPDTQMTADCSDLEIFFTTDSLVLLTDIVITTGSDVEAHADWRPEWWGLGEHLNRALYPLISTSNFYGLPGTSNRTDYTFPTQTGGIPNKSYMLRLTGRSAIQVSDIRVYSKTTTWHAAFDADGGSIDGFADQYVLQGCRLVRPKDPVRGIDHFLGWFEEGSDAPFDFDTPVTRDIALTARWEKRHTVTFEANGGSFRDEAKQTRIVAEGECAAQPEAPTAQNCVFQCWNAKDADAPFDFSTPIMQDITLTAQWKVRVSFACVPEGTEVTVYPASAQADALPVVPEAKGRYLLPPGNYTYTVEAEGYTSKTAVPFTASMENSGQTISVALTYADYAITIDGPENWIAATYVNNAQADTAHAGDIVTLKVEQGYTAETVRWAGGEIKLEPDELDEGVYTFAMPAGDVIPEVHLSPLLGWGWTQGYVPDGSAGNPYILSSGEGWNLMCELLMDNDHWNRFNGKTVKLGTDIFVSEMAGKSHHDFCGTFDGDGKTLTFTRGTLSEPETEEGCAPFQYVSESAVIRNLNVRCDIYSAAPYTGGLIGKQYGNAIIRNCTVRGSIQSEAERTGGFVGLNYSDATLYFLGCVSDVTISTSAKYAGGFVADERGKVGITDCESRASIFSDVGSDGGNTDGTHGGFVALVQNYTNAEVTITGCAFTGRMVSLYTSHCGGFIGWNAKIGDIYDSIFAPSRIDLNTEGCSPFVRNDGATSFSNCYYVQPMGDGNSNKYKKGYEVSAGAGIKSLGFGTPKITHEVSGISAYKNGLALDGKLYAGSGEAVKLTLTADTGGGRALAGYADDHGSAIVHSSGDSYTLTMPDADTTISAVFMEQGQVPIRVTGVSQKDSAFSSGEGWENLFDNNPATQMTAKCNELEISFTTDSDVNLSAIVITTGTDIESHSEMQLTSWTLWVDNAGKNYPIIASSEKNGLPGKQDRADYTFKPTFGKAALDRNFRLKLTGRSGIQLSDIRVYANTETASVIFKTNGGNLSAPMQQYVIKGRCLPRPDDPVRSGNTFTGWYAGNSGQSFDFEHTPINGDITLMAHWNTVVVPYVDAEGKEHFVENVRYINTETLTDGWYLARIQGGQGNYPDGARFVVKGDVKLILEDNWQFICHKGLTITANGKLTIYGQKKQNGWLIAFSNGEYCIGGNGQLVINSGNVQAKNIEHDQYDSRTYYERGISCYNLVINGGVVSATSYTSGAAIGGGQGSNVNNTGEPRDGGNITINGGRVTASNKGQGGAAIGGDLMGHGGNITINGGIVIARCDQSVYPYPYMMGAAIGGGNNGHSGNITINGGTVEAYGKYGAGIGTGRYASAEGIDYNRIVINGGMVMASSSQHAAAIGCGELSKLGEIRITGGTVTAKIENSSGAAAIGISDLFGGYVTISGGTVTATSDKYGVGIGVGTSVYGHEGYVSIVGGTVIADSIGYRYGAALNIRLGNKVSSSKGSFHVRCEEFPGGMYAMSNLAYENTRKYILANSSTPYTDVEGGILTDAGFIYSVSLREPPKNGAIDIRPNATEPGNDVMVQANPDYGYVLESLTAQEEGGGPVTLSGSNGTYYVPVGNKNISLTASFTEKQDVYYKDEKGGSGRVKEGDYNFLATEDSLSMGWYVARGTVTLDKPVRLKGNVKLILEDGAVLNVQSFVPEIGARLTVYGQSNMTGRLVVEKLDSDIAIYSGTVRANTIGGKGRAVLFGGGIVNADSVEGSSITLTHGDVNTSGMKLTVKSFQCDSGVVTLKKDFLNYKSYEEHRKNSSRPVIFYPEGSYSGNDALKSLTEGTVVPAELLKVRVDNTVRNGQVIVSSDMALLGDIITFSTVPDTNYALVEGSVAATDASGKELRLVPVEGAVNTWTFEMPNSDVTVTAAFEELKGYRYVDENGDTQFLQNYVQLVDQSDLPSGWYVAEGVATLSNRVTVSGDVNLLLCDGCAASLSQGIEVGEGCSLTIYGQTEGSGQLNAASAASQVPAMGVEGTVTFNGGVVTAIMGSDKAAGIGSGEEGKCGTIIVNRGKVNATGGVYAAGIGGGYKGDSGTVIINGGSVTAYGGTDENGNGNGAGIGAGNAGTLGSVVINGGTVNATGAPSGAGIGGGKKSTGGEIRIVNGNVTAVGGRNGAGIGAGDTGAVDSVVVEGGTVIATGGENAAGVGGGYNGEGCSVTITGGSVTATGGESGAGIGSAKKGVGCAVKISGGTVNATGGGDSAGIGAGDSGKVGNVDISGGTITAMGGKGGYGIGGKQDRTSSVNVTGGSVTATGGADGAGIGGEGGFIYLLGGRVEAHAGENSVGLGFLTTRTSNLPNVTLGWTHEDDFIWFDSVSAKVTVADGQTLIDENNTQYTGTVADPSAMANQKLMCGGPDHGSASPMDASSVVVLSASLTLKGQIGLNFRIKCGANVSPNAKAVLTYKGGTAASTRLSTLTPQPGTTDEYIITWQVSAKEMANPVALQVLDASGTPCPLTNSKGIRYADERFEYSVTDYCAKVSELYAGTKLGNLIDALRNYGACAWRHFGTADAEPIMADGADLSGITAESLKSHALSVHGAVDGVKLKTMTLMLKSETNIVLRFVTDPDVRLSSLKVTSSNPNTTLAATVDGFTVTLSNVSARNLDAAQTVTISHQSQSMTVISDALSYAYTVLQSGEMGEKLKNVVKALALYNLAAKAYFEQ